MIMLKTFERSPSLAELKVSYRRGRGKDDRQINMPWLISTPTSCEQYLRSVWDKSTIELREDFLLVCLNGANEVLGWVKLASGGMDTATVDPRLVFSVALQTASAAIIVAHNHPSGSLKPSREDMEVTRRLQAGANLLGIRFLDHLIITAGGAYSFAEAGLLREEMIPEILAADRIRVAFPLTLRESGRFNGWVNYETWCVALWLNNDEPSYRYWRAEANRHMREAGRREYDASEQLERARKTLAKQLREELEREDLIPNSGCTGLYADLLSRAISRVDWVEIAEDFLEEFEESSEVAERAEYSSRLENQIAPRRKPIPPELLRILGALLIALSELEPLDGISENRLEESSPQQLPEVLA